MKHRIAVFTLLISVTLIAGNAKHQVFEVRVSAAALVGEIVATSTFTLGGWRIYDRQGRQVGEIGGAGDEHFRESLNAVLQSPEPVGSQRTLDWELSRLEDRSGRPLVKLPEADLTMVKYWAKSCEPCRDQDQAQARTVQEVLASYKTLTVNILHVDADVPRKARKVKKK
jgi:hypothetical protein